MVHGRSMTISVLAILIPKHCKWYLLPACDKDSNTLRSYKAWKYAGANVCEWAVTLNYLWVRKFFLCQFPLKEKHWTHWHFDHHEEKLCHHELPQIMKRGTKGILHNLSDSSHLVWDSRYLFSEFCIHKLCHQTWNLSPHSRQLCQDWCTQAKHCPCNALPMQTVQKIQRAQQEQRLTALQQLIWSLQSSI